MNLVWSVGADRDLDEIATYIEQDSSSAAGLLEDRIVQAVEMLLEFPQIGRPGRVSGTRELVVSGTPYIAAYRVQGNTVTVLRVLHGAQRWPEEMEQ